MTNDLKHYGGLKLQITGNDDWEFQRKLKHFFDSKRPFVLIQNSFIQSGSDIRSFRY